MSPATGRLLIEKIAPILMGTIPRVIRPVGAEDIAELQQDALAQAAAVLDSAERRGKTVPAQSVAYYVIQRIRCGRRSTGSSRTDVLAPATQIQGRSAIDSMDADVEIDDDGGTVTLHGLLADTRDDTDTAAARRIDWERVTGRLDDRRRGILKATAEGFGTGEIAAMYDVSAPRVCQIRGSIGRFVVAAWGSNGLADVATVPTWMAGLRAGTERRAARYARALQQRKR